MGTESMRKRMISPTLAAASPVSPTSPWHPSSESEQSSSSSNKQKLLEWSGEFSGFIEQEEESPASSGDALSEFEANVAMKRSVESVNDSKVQIGQPLPVWKRLKLGPFDSA